MSMLRRHMKAQFHASWLLQPLWLAAMLGWLFASPRPLEARQIADLYGIFEYYLPLALAIYLAGVPAFDREQGASETHLGYVQLPALRLAFLALPRLIAWAAMVGVALLAVDLWYLDGQSRALLDVLSRPALALGGVALAGAAASRSQLGGLLAALLWWALDAMGRGFLNKQFFLFRMSVRTGLFTVTEQGRNIALIGAAGLALALWAAHRRTWWIR